MIRAFENIIIISGQNPISETHSMRLKIIGDDPGRYNYLIFSIDVHLLQSCHITSVLG